MSCYSDNPIIDDIVLTIINDGAGAQCGMTYEERCGAAECGLFDFRAACWAYGRYRHRVYGARHPERPEVIEAADILQAYYRNHVKERQS